VNGPHTTISNGGTASQNIHGSSRQEPVSHGLDHSKVGSLRKRQRLPEPGEVRHRRSLILHLCPRGDRKVECMSSNGACIRGCYHLVIRQIQGQKLINNYLAVRCECCRPRISIFSSNQGKSTQGYALVENRSARLGHRHLVGFGPKAARASRIDCTMNPKTKTLCSARMSLWSFGFNKDFQRGFTQSSGANAGQRSSHALYSKCFSVTNCLVSQVSLVHYRSNRSLSLLQRVSDR
jgi:hypothetical protein